MCQTYRRHTVFYSTNLWICLKICAYQSEKKIMLLCSDLISYVLIIIINPSNSCLNSLTDSVEIHTLLCIWIIPRLVRCSSISSLLITSALLASLYHFSLLFLRLLPALFSSDINISQPYPFLLRHFLLSYVLQLNKEK